VGSYEIGVEGIYEVGRGVLMGAPEAALGREVVALVVNLMGARELYV
jgi:hypothetical protein